MHIHTISGELLEKGRKEVKYKDISSIYNGAFKASKESGTHDNFGDTAAVEANPWLNYPHLLIEERGANSDELRRQSSAVFSDSTRGRPHSNSSASSGIRQRRDRGGGKGSGREKKKQKVW